MQLQDLLTNAFDDLIEEDEAASELEATNYEHSASASSKALAENHAEFNGNSLYSPLYLHQADLMSETQYHSSENQNLASTSFDSLSQHNHKKHCVRFSPLEEPADSSPHLHRQLNQDSNADNMREHHYLSSGLNSQAELEILYAARGSEIKKLTLELHQLQHKTALLGN